MLRGLATRAVSDAPRRTHRRPARTWIAMEAEAGRTGGPAPVFQPGIARGSDRPRVIVGLDTSGSVDDALLARFAAEIAGIARRTGAETRVLAFDESVHAEIPMGAGSGRPRSHLSPSDAAAAPRSSMCSPARTR